MPADDDLPLDLLTPAEQQRAARILDPTRGNLLARRRILLRKILSQNLRTPPQYIEIEEGIYGKPAVPGHPLHFSLAGSGGWVAIALCTGCEVGIDIEERRTIDDADKLAERYFAPSEADLIRSLAEPERSHVFLRSWTRKEALMKADGRGMRSGIVAVDTGIPRHVAENLAVEAGGKSYRLHDILAVPEVVMSLASTGTGPVRLELNV
jgi:4'-phosphopantetheinyl transferase